MLPVFWFLLFLVGACLFLLMSVLWGREIYTYYHGVRAVTCPETRQQVAVSFDALHAAATGLSRKPALRLADCTRWPMRMDCGQECIPEALQTEPYTRGEVNPPKTKKIYHLPVLIAAFAAWILGAIWHSEYLFREQWTESVGLSQPELRQIVEWLSPQLLSLAVPLLFAYGVAWLLAPTGGKGVWRGIVTSSFLWLAIGAAVLVGRGLAGISGNLLKIEAAYTFLASLAVGAIIGGLGGKLVKPALEEGEGSKRR